MAAICAMGIAMRVELAVAADAAGQTFNVRYVKGDQVDPQRIATAKDRALEARGGRLGVSLM